VVRKIIWSANAQSNRKEILSYWIKRNKSNTYSKKLNNLFLESLSILKKYPQNGMPTSISNVELKLLKIISSSMNLMSQNYLF
jgi:toxin YoeB